MVGSADPVVQPSLHRDRPSQPVERVGTNGNDVARVPANQREPVGSNEELAGSGHPGQYVAGELADIAAGQTRAEGAAADVNHHIELKIGLPVSSADGERTVGLAR